MKLIQKIKLFQATINFVGNIIHNYSEEKTKIYLNSPKEIAVLARQQMKS